MLKVKLKGSIFNAKTIKKWSDSVGEVYITAVIRNPADPERMWEGEFLVDTGATDTMVPRQHLEAIGLVSEGQRVYGLADGNEIRFDIAGARIEFEGEITWETLAFGAETAEPLLGVTVLESAGYQVDPHNTRR